MLLSYLVYYATTHDLSWNTVFNTFGPCDFEINHAVLISHYSIMHLWLLVHIGINPGGDG